MSEMLAPVPQVYRTGQLGRIGLRVSAEAEPMLRDRGWDGESEMRWLHFDDGNWLLRVRAFLDGANGWCLRDAARFVLSLGPRVRVESPAELGECVLAMAREIAEQA